MRTLPIKIFSILFIFLLFLMCNNSDNKIDSAKTFDNTEKNYDIAILIDISITMLSKDFEPDRMTAVKNKIEEIIDKKDDEQAFSLIVFAGNSYVICPLTNNKQELKKSLAKIDILWKRIRYGTNYSDAFLNGIYSLQNSKNDKKILVFSDGAANAKNDKLQFSIDALENYTVNVNSVILIPKDYEIILKKIDKNGSHFEKTPVKPLDSTLIEISKKTNGNSAVFHTNQELNNLDVKQFIKIHNDKKARPTANNFDQNAYNLMFKKLNKTTDSINIKLQFK